MAGCSNTMRAVSASPVSRALAAKLHGQDAVATQAEEVVVPADFWQLEHVGEDGRPTSVPLGCGPVRTGPDGTEGRGASGTVDVLQPAVLGPAGALARRTKFRRLLFEVVLVLIADHTHRDGVTPVVEHADPGSRGEVLHLPAFLAGRRSGRRAASDRDRRRMRRAPGRANAPAARRWRAGTGRSGR